jgi:hypothetical protein
MAERKTNRFPKRRTRRPSFPEIKDKIVDSVEVHNTDIGVAIGIMFKDRSYLCFDVEAEMTVTPDLSDWKTGNYRPLKRWRPITT